MHYSAVPEYIWFQKKTKVFVVFVALDTEGRILVTNVICQLICCARESTNLYIYFSIRIYTLQHLTQGLGEIIITCLAIQTQVRVHTFAQMKIPQHRILQVLCGHT